MTIKQNLAVLHTFDYAGAQINIYFAKEAGQGLAKHEHDYSHATYCCSGSLIVRKENKTLKIDKMSQPINLIANEWHELEAAEPNTLFINVFALGKY